MWSRCRRGVKLRPSSHQSFRVQIVLASVFMAICENWDPAAAWRGGVASAERAAAEVASGLGLAYELAAEKLEGVAAGLRQAAAGAAGAGAGAGSPRRSPP